MICLRTLPLAAVLASLPAFGAPPLADQAPTPLSSPATEARVDSLLASMTLEEKAGQLNQISVGGDTGPAQASLEKDLVAKGKVGAILNAVTAEDTNERQRQAVEGSRLHIPLLFGLDVIHGYRTEFPIPLALSASWDLELIEATARLAAGEASSQGVRWTFSPMVDIARDPRWGRIAEGAGEDPYLGSLVARAYVHGYQGSSLSSPSSILACAKHFVGYGAAEGGREYNTTEISEGTLRNVYLPPFRAATAQGVATVMSAFNSLNGTPASANPFTLTQVLRKEWHFSGFVDSDWTAVKELMLHGVADDEATAAKKAFLAGVDMDMVSAFYLRHLRALVRSGEVPEARLDDAVRRILRLKSELGLFEHPYVSGGTALAVTPAGRALARRAAEESFVLVSNRPEAGVPLLPLDLHARKRIALIGPLADNAKEMLGSWTCQSKPSDVVTLRTALEAAPGLKVMYRKGVELDTADSSGIEDAVSIARKADVAILALGEPGRSSGEASSRSEIGLPGRQEALLEAVARTGTPIVLVVFSGRPLALSWAAEHVPAILLTWFPGIEAGPAISRTLLGEAAPQGRLTVSVPRSVGQIPVYYNALNTGRPRVDPIGLGAEKQDPYYNSGYLDQKNSPLYPFGYGLSYTHFTYSAVTLDRTSVSAAAIARNEAVLTASAEVSNDGARPGTETAQLYIRLRGTSVARPVHELKGYQRLHLEPGQHQRVTFRLGRDELSFFGADLRESVEPASLYVWVAPDSASGQPARATLTP